MYLSNKWYDIDQYDQYIWFKGMKKWEKGKEKLKVRKIKILWKIGQQIGTMKSTPNFEPYKSKISQQTDATNKNFYLFRWEPSPRKGQKKLDPYEICQFW